MHISETEINKKNDKLICSANVRSQETYKKLWYEIEAKFLFFELNDPTVRLFYIDYKSYTNNLHNCLIIKK